MSPAAAAAAAVNWNYRGNVNVLSFSFFFSNTEAIMPDNKMTQLLHIFIISLLVPSHGLRESLSECNNEEKRPRQSETLTGKGLLCGSMFR